MRSRATVLYRFAALALVLLAFGVRVWLLGAQSLWFDEGWSWHLAGMPLADMVTITAGDRSPLLYYALLHGWMVLAGPSEFALRFLSTGADLVTLAAVIALAKKIGGRGAAGAAGALYALSPSAVWYAQEARMYAQVATLCTLASLLLWRWLDDPARRRPLVASAVLLALAIHSHYYAIFLLPAHALLVLGTLLLHSQQTHAGRPVFAVRDLAAWASAALGVLAVILPWLWFARGGFAYSDGFAFPLNTIDGRLSEWLRWFVTSGLPAQLAALQSLALGIPVGVALIRLATLQRWQALFRLLALILTPLLAATIAVRIFFPFSSVFHPRYLIYCAPLVCVLIGAAAMRIRPARASQRLLRGLEIALALVPLAFWVPLLGAYFTDPAYQRDNNRGAVQHVVEALQPGDIIVASRDNFAVNYYMPAAQRDRLIAAPDGLHGLLASDQIVLDKLNLRAPKRVRLLLWQDDIVDPQRLLETTLRANGRQIGEYNFGQIRLPLYQIERTPLEPIALAPVKANALFADGDSSLRLLRSWTSQQAKTNGLFYVVLEWQPQRRITRDFKVFVHVTDASGAVVFQQDKLALNALLPTSTWPPGITQRDPYAMLVPAELAAGRYTVRVGLYDPVTNKRLSTPDGDAVVIAEVEISR